MVVTEVFPSELISHTHICVHIVVMDGPAIMSRLG